jgi:hypothetical protein
LALEGGYTWESASPEKQRGNRAMFTLTRKPALSVSTSRVDSLSPDVKGSTTIKRHETVFVLHWHCSYKSPYCPTWG